MTTLTDILHLAAVLWALRIRVTDAATLRTSHYTCPVKCTCDNTQITCQDHIPRFVPDAMEEININLTFWSQFEVDKIIPGIFCNVTWQNVRKMSIIGDSIGNSIYLGDGRLHCLEKLQTLRVRNVGIYPHKGSLNLTGLINLSTLEISSSFLDPDVLYRLFSEKQNLPKLVNLTLSRCYHKLTLDDRFVSALSQREIKELNVSSSGVYFNLNHSGTLCDTLTHLILRDSDITIESLPTECASLQHVDLTGVNYFVNKFKISCFYKDSGIYMDPFFRAQALYMNRMITASLGDIIPICFLNIPNIVKEFHFSQNVLPRFEIRFINYYLEYINLSHNRIETIHPGTFWEIPSCKSIDLSANNLHVMGIPKALFSNLLRSDRLKAIDLSSNNISAIADFFFKSTINLEKIKLSKNRLTQIGFKISHLLNLIMLDLRFNNIQNFDSNSRHQLEDLYKAQQQMRTLTHSNVSLAVKLEGNPFSCSCDYKEFVQWFARSPVFDNTRHNQHCHLHQEKYILDYSAVNVAIDDCEKAARERKIILLSTILPAISVGIVSIALITLYRRRKRRLQKHIFEDRLRLVLENRMEFKFPVFLSYSSLDLEFVVNHVRQPLQQQLQAIIQTDRDLVCDADIHFIPGHNIYQEMSRCIQESAVFVAVISENYCKSDHCQIEISEARTTGKPILLIFKEHVEEDKMKIVIKEIFHNFTRIKFVEEEGEYRIQPGWEQVCKSIIEML